jgi:hypothetical protein
MHKSVYQQPPAKIWFGHWSIAIVFSFLSLPPPLREVRLSPLGTLATNWRIVPALDVRWWWWMWSSQWNENWQGKLKYLEKTCPSATLSTTNLTWPNLGHRCGKPVIDCLSYFKSYIHLTFKPSVFSPARKWCGVDIILLVYMKAIQKVTSSELLKKQAMREKIIIYKNYVHT